VLRFLEPLGFFILSLVVGISILAAFLVVGDDAGGFLNKSAGTLLLIKLHKFPGILLSMLIEGVPIFSVFFVLFVLPLTTFFKNYRLLPAFGLMLVCWAAFAGAAVAVTILFVFDYADYSFYVWFEMGRLSAIAGATAALCWWLTSRRRWARASRLAQKLRP